MTMLHVIFRSESTLIETPGNIARRKQYVRAIEGLKTVYFSNHSNTLLNNKKMLSP